jgi:DUF4097 and DUF4098 domain-containing protein YvlB
MIRRNISALTSALAGAACALSLLAPQALAHPANGGFTQEFHQTYPIGAEGRLELENINGSVHISAWDRNEVKVDAIKTAGTQERLDEAKINIDAGSSSIAIHTEYPNHDLTFNHDDRDNPASVEYTLTVPRSLRIDEVKLINGGLDVEGLSGEVRASTINGHLQASQLSGPVRLETINGRLDAEFTVLSHRVELSSVNGHVAVVLPSDANARVEANTVHGSIDNEFGLEVSKHHFVGHSMHGELGSGGTQVRLNNVNGGIEIRHANDGRSLSPARSENNSDDRGSDDDDI